MKVLANGDQDVLAFVRTGHPGSHAVVVAMNMSDHSRTISLNLHEANLEGTRAETIAASDPALKGIVNLNRVSLPAYSAWIASVEP